MLAGGALETHLRSMVGRHGLDHLLDAKARLGIGAYNQAIARARKQNPPPPVYPAADGDLVSGWAKIRDVAAHNPIGFCKLYDDASVEAMISGIRRIITTYF